VADRPLAIDLFCGLGGWAEGLMAECWAAGDDPEVVAARVREIFERVLAKRVSGP